MIFKCVTLADFEDHMVGTMSFTSLADAVAVAMEQWSAQHHVFNVETFFRIVAVLKYSECFASISVLLITEKFLAAILDSVYAVHSPQNIETVFLVKVRRKRGRGSVWVCPLGALQVAITCLTLMFKPKYSGLLEISSTGVSGGR
jgi:hypothetical protein